MASVCTAEATRAAEQRWFDAHPGQDLMDIAAQAAARKAQELLLGGAVDEIMPDWAASQCVLVLFDGMSAKCAVPGRSARIFFPAPNHHQRCQ